MVDSLRDAHRRQRVIGALLGWVVGDALGAPFEFGPGGAYSRRFPTPMRGLHTEMCGGGPWRAGEWTDDSQMGLAVADSLLTQGGLDEADIFDRFKAWLASGPKDVGIQTRSVLGSNQPWDVAARRHFESGARAAGNGSIMRTLPAAIFFARSGADASEDAARAISDLTHGDPYAGDACAIYHRMIHAALQGHDPLTTIGTALAAIPAERRSRWESVLDPAWTPADATEPNGAVWPTLGTAAWALRQGWHFEEAMRHVIDIGGDTDTIACVAGGLLGAVQGVQSIPSRWVTPLNGDFPGRGYRDKALTELIDVALRLDGAQPSSHESPKLAPIAPVEVVPGLWLTNLDGGAGAPSDAVVISLCRTFDRIPQERRRQVYVTDDDANLDIDGVLADVVDTIEAVHTDGAPVVVHCYGGQSRTGLVLRAWLRRTEGLSAAEATEKAQGIWPSLGLWNPSFDAALERCGV
ncbi:MAG TPA: ADP-ribosylglycohydrolase family protein [Mycobacteriales bacterium]|nr:ADP-ribosylglycohydrolase family protein [Mycobacteriales bacterium]